MVEPWAMVGYQLQGSYQSSPPKVGFGVVCRCPGSGVQCLLQKRGLNSASPNKWSFPGGRLENPGDLDEDGDVGTRRELEEECGGGEPLGLPSLIHIECYKSGKVKQTIYHVYAIDTSTNKEWELWKPKPKNERTEVDTMATELVVNSQSFPSLNGYCWVDMHALIQECDKLACSQVDITEATDLQHGLVRWVQNYGDHVLRTLIQRSPKLPHHSPRRHSSSSTSSSSGTNGSGPKSRSKSDLTPKSQRYRATPELLTPPFAPIRPPTPFQAPLMANHSPTHNFYGMGLPVMSPTAMPASGLGNQQGAMQYVRFPALIPSSTGVPQPMGSVSQQPQQQQAIVASPPQTGRMVYHPLPTQFGMQQALQQQPTGVGLASPGVGTGLVLSGLSPGNAGEIVVGGQDGMLASSPPSEEAGITTAVSDGSDSAGGNATGMEIISKLMHGPRHQQASAFHHVTVPHPIVAGHILEQQQGAGGGGGGGCGGGGGAGGSGVMTSSLQYEGSHHLQHQITTTVPGNPQELQHYSQQATTSIPSLPHHFPPGTVALPPPHTAAAVTVDHPEALLPAPQVVSSIPPLAALAQATNHRKEILCRYFIAGHGHCPYGDKCWFAHIEPSPSVHPRDFATLPQTTAPPSTPLHIQVPPPAHGWNPNMPMQYVASPPQSPLDGGYLTPADPSTGARPPILHPSPPYHFPGQPPILVWQPPPGRGPRNFPLLPSMRPPLPVPIDPTLHFNLLSEVVVMSDGPEGGPVRNVSQLTTRADHFYIAYENKVRDYKILFSGQRTHQDSWILQDTFSFLHRVTCLHSSRQQQFLLLVGTETGSVYTCALRRGNQYGQPSIVSHICTIEPPAAVTSLVHFSTSISLAQVIVVGTQAGTISWYIAQPPQKTYSLLSYTRPHYPHSVVALQVWGGMLVSGSREGKLIVWSMRTQQPAISSEQHVHSVSLSSIHIQDHNAIITIGRGSSVQKDGESPGIAATGQTNQSLEQSPVPSSSNVVLQESTGPSINQLAKEVAHMSVGDAGNSSATGQLEDTVTLWQYSVPLRPTKIQEDLGEIVTSVFHHAHTGNMFLALGLSNRTIKILNLPNFSLASELHFPEMAGKRCLHMALNLSRESPVLSSSYYRNPFRDLILTTAWSDGKVMICQVSKQ